MPRGILLLINCEYFDERLDTPNKKYKRRVTPSTREGTEQDATALTKLFKDLGFEVVRLDNPTKKEIGMFMEDMVTEEKMKENSVCAFTILSHDGIEEGTVSTKDREIEIKTLVQYYKKEYLAGKPKFFIIQACRGGQYMPAIDGGSSKSQYGSDGGDVTDSGPRQSEFSDQDQINNLALPSEADFLYAYSTPPEYLSWRNEKDGSWFIQDLVEVFNDNADKMHVIDMLAEVNHQMAGRKSEKGDPKNSGKKQISSCTTQLRKTLFLLPPYELLREKTEVRPIGK
ncbi:caspase-7-like [Clytia hemisphaerica]|uniref:caspase-7-like n=1 Tax=Clytia hemisphaerica TaxID=252671 RepID=UPI0034D4D86D